MDLEQFDEAFDTEVGEGDDAFVVETVDPDEAVLGLHYQSDVIERVGVLAEFLCDKIDGLDMRDLVNMDGLKPPSRRWPR